MDSSNTVLGVPDDSHSNESVAFNAIEHLDSLFIKTKAKLADSTYIEYPRKAKSLSFAAQF